MPYHTYRPSGNYNTICQDQERVVYYFGQPYLKNNNIILDDIDIHIYGDIDCAKFSAGWEGYRQQEGYDKLRNKNIDLASCLKWKRSRIWREDNQKNRHQKNYEFEFGHKKFNFKSGEKNLNELKNTNLNISKRLTMGDNNHCIKDITNAFKESLTLSHSIFKYRFNKIINGKK